MKKSAKVCLFLYMYSIFLSNLTAGSPSRTLGNASGSLLRFLAVDGKWDALRLLASSHKQTRSTQMMMRKPSRTPLSGM